MDTLFSSPFLLLVQVCKLWAPPLPSSTTAAVASSRFHDTITFCFFFPTTSVTLTGHIESEMKKCRGPGAKWESFHAPVVDWLEIFSFLVFFCFWPQIHFTGILWWTRADFFSLSTCLFALVVCQPAQFCKMITWELAFFVFTNFFCSGFVGLSTSQVDQTHQGRLCFKCHCKRTNSHFPR